MQDATAHCGEQPQLAMRALHRTLAAGADDADASVDNDNPAFASVATRLQLAGQPLLSAPRVPSIETDSDDRLSSTPPLNRISMVPQPWGELNPLLRWLRMLSGRHDPAAQTIRRGPPSADAPDPRGNWQRVGGWRRLILLILMFGQTGLATYFMSTVLPYQGTRPMEIVTLALFAVLFCWISAGFWTAMAGFLVLLRGG
ncbi:MAG: glucan biosynthesis glucosyltransferase H, partial [Oxalobacteraceae bacterium]